MTIKGTETVKHICGNLSSDLQLEFEKWPIPEIRQACLVRMGNWVITEEIAVWAEKTITELLQLRDEMGEQLLEWYLLYSKSAFGNIEDYEEYVSRALKFAIDLKDSFPDLFLPKISEIVARVMLKDGNSPMYLYEKLPFLKDFLCESLGKLRCPLQGYGKQEWECAERALWIIDEAEDCAFIGWLEDFLVYMREDHIVRIDRGKFPSFAKKCHETAIAELIGKLKEKAKDAK